MTTAVSAFPSRIQQARTELKQKKEEKVEKNKQEAFKRSGQVQCFLNDGEFIGLMKDDVPVSGMIKFHNGIKFDGDWKDGKPHFGWWTIEDMEYKGELDENGKFTGYGMLFTRFFYYTGNFLNGLFHGRGGLVLQGEHYFGTYRDYWGYWKNGMFHGRGMLYFGASQGWIEGVWCEGKYVSKRGSVKTGMNLLPADQF